MRRNRSIGAIGLSLGLLLLGSPPSTGATARSWSVAWSNRYGAPHEVDVSFGLAVGQHGRRVFAVGPGRCRLHEGTTCDFLTEAYDATTGVSLWRKTYNSSDQNVDHTFNIAVDPTGSSVFVTGWSYGADPGDFRTISYSASDGRRRWLAVLDGGADSAEPIAVAAGRSMVFVTGWLLPAQDTDPIGTVTVAYDASTGAEQWRTSFGGAQDPQHQTIQSADLQVSPDGRTLYVTGTIADPQAPIEGSGDIWTAAYDASSGSELWSVTYRGRTGAFASATGLAVDPEGTMVYVGGSKASPSPAYIAIAYDASTGARRWVAHTTNPGDNQDGPSAVALSPDGSELVLTGEMWGYRRLRTFRIGTVAYDTGTGKPLWKRRYLGPIPGYNFGVDVAMTADGSAVVILGKDRYDMVLVAYDALRGTPLWNDTRPGQPGAIEAGPSGPDFFLTGSVHAAGSGTHDRATITIRYDAR